MIVFMKTKRISQILKSTFSLSQTLAWVILASACTGQKEEGELTSENQIPELVLVDSLVIDRLVQPYLIDVKDDGSEYLFYDFQKDELLRVGSKGEILKVANRTGDGKDSYKSRYFTTADYFGDDKILIFTNPSSFIYDLDFNLIEEKKIDFGLVTRRIGGSNAAEVYKDYLYTFSVELESMEDLFKSENFSVGYPFIRLRNLETFEVLSSDSIPKSSQMAITPGKYIALDPLVRFVGDKMYALFPNSPELYIYDLPSLSLNQYLSLDPGENYKQIQPMTEERNFDGFFKALASSQYVDFIFSNGYLLTQYEGAAPQDEVDALPKNIVGGEEFNALEEKYKDKRYYQIFKGDQKLWEGTWPITLESKKGFLYSVNAKMGEDPDAIERDVQTFYFYELR